MSITPTTTRVLITVGLVSTALVAPAATAATAAPTKPGPTGIRYTGEIIGPRAESQEYPFGTRAQGISDAGDVLVTSSSRPTFVVTRRGVRELASTEGIAENSSNATAMARSGHVYGGGHDGVFRWAGSKAALSVVQDPDRTTFQGYGLRAANVRGDVAGCAHNYRVAEPFVGSFAKGTVKTLTWPKDSGNCSVTGISDRGVAAVNQEAPNFRTEEIYPRAATMTTSGVTYLKTRKGFASSADGISPNGKYIVGRVTKDGASTVAWLSHRRNPVALLGAGAMTPKLVTDRGVVVGVENDRVVTWENGRKSDLTSVSRLPRGWVLSDVSGINRRGQLAVTATKAGGHETVAMRLTAKRR